MFASRRKLERLNAASTVVDTAVGPVEYARTDPESSDSPDVRDTPDAPVVVLVPGTPQGHPSSFFAAPLVEAGFTVITPSRPGYLRTPLSSGRTFEEQAEAISALLDVLEIERAAIYGVSGGGPSSIHFAAQRPQRPQRTAALILEVAVSQTLKPDVPDWLVAMAGGEFFHALNRLLLRRFPRAAVGQFVKFESTLDARDRRRTVDAIVADPERMAFLQRLFESSSPMSAFQTGFRNDLEQFRKLPPLPFAEVRCPTLVVHGTHDRDVPYAHAQLSADRIDGAQLHTVEQGWHLLRLGDDPHGHTEAELAFLREHLAAPKSV